MLGFPSHSVGLPCQWIDIVVQAFFFILRFPVGIVILVAILLFDGHPVAFVDPQGNLNGIRKSDPLTEDILVLTSPTTLVGAMEP